MKTKYYWVSINTAQHNTTYYSITQRHWNTCCVAWLYYVWQIHFLLYILILIKVEIWCQRVWWKIEEAIWLLLLHYIREWLNKTWLKTIARVLNCLTWLIYFLSNQQHQHYTNKVQTSKPFKSSCIILDNSLLASNN